MRICDIAKLITKSIDPRKRPDTIWNLYSLPAFDNGKKCEEVLGSEIMSNKYIVPTKCILFNKLTVRFKRIWQINSTDAHNICSTEFLPLVIDESLADFNYIYHFFHSDYITNYLTGQNRNTSGSHKRIEPSDFMNINIQLPPLETQRKIGKILSCIESKIFLNEQINRNLFASAV